MINLLPPQIKEQVVYAKRNALVLHYLQLVVFITLILGGTFAGAHIYLQRRITAAEADAQQKQLAIAKFKGLEKNVADLNGRVATIKNIQAAQSKYSLLLSDLAQAVPAGVAIDSLNLTGDDKKPVIISATADSYNSAVGFRDALANNKRIAAADLQSVTNGTAGGVQAQIVVAFKPGQAK